MLSKQRFYNNLIFWILCIALRNLKMESFWSELKFIVHITLVFIFSPSLDHQRRWLLFHLLRVFWGKRHINLESKVKTCQRYESRFKFWLPQKTSRHLCISFSTYYHACSFFFFSWLNVVQILHKSLLFHILNVL